MADKRATEFIVGRDYYQRIGKVTFSKVRLVEAPNDPRIDMAVVKRYEMGDQGEPSGPVRRVHPTTLYDDEPEDVGMAAGRKKRTRKTRRKTAHKKRKTLSKKK